MVWTSHPVARFQGAIRAPGDKSCSHRALMFAGIAEGTSDISGLLEGEDVLNTAKAMGAMGATLQSKGGGRWTIEGTGRAGLASPSGDLDFGNSGTGSRLMMGLMAGYPITAHLVGDESLSKRPMNRVIKPLERMGARFEHDGRGMLPLTLHGSEALQAIDFAPEQASAQVKSCVLLAGLNAEGTTQVTESRPTRDHTEKMLRGFGVTVSSRPGPGTQQVIRIEGGQHLSAVDTVIPGDPSSAAFMIAGALISPSGGVVVEGIMSNETRDGFFQAASLMGAGLGAEEIRDAAGERLIDLQAATTGLKGCAIPETLVASMIDEFPILAVLAAFAEGETVVSGAEELRVKESDRIAAVVAMLRVNGVEVEERADGFVVQGCGGPPPGGGLVETHHDHRIAMSALVMGTASQKPVSIDDPGMIATSYPDFMAHMAELGADIREG
ncbi:3-phosphoshikimate 1-carboxyvinyltransferase [Henriciella aquimarina]|uniref:3-phosphoshikimate 1-carboxyvinyltransferase n=1 Tax=Henriciella aquimarina TaxID=545261 RepID=UPI000A02268B|nr:3-phosphoshikimate 1-carboxyvinyltransferase [Henriciella aquimarina]